MTETPLNASDNSRFFTLKPLGFYFARGGKVNKTPFSGNNPNEEK